MFAGVAELADAPDLGSGGITVGVQVPSPAPTKTEHLSTDKCSVFVYPSRRLGISSPHEVRSAR